MLKVTSLVRSYGDFKAVDNVSFEILPGQIVGLLGHNGAGKTTIMKMLSGFLEADSGTVTLDEKSIDTELQDIQQVLGYLPESLPLYQDMVVADYLQYAAQLKGIPTENSISEIKRVIAETGITEKVLSPIATLSRGFKQRVGVAQALLGEPALLILDEPTNGLDPHQTEQMRNLIKKISEKATVLLSTHIMQEVEAVCDRVLILHRGKLAVDTELASLKQSRTLHLATSQTEDELRTALSELEQVEKICTLEESAAGPEECQFFHLEMRPDSDRFEVSALVSETVAKAGGKVYELKTVERDLESLVRQVGISEEQADAA